MASTKVNAVNVIKQAVQHMLGTALVAVTIMLSIYLLVHMPYLLGLLVGLSFVIAYLDEKKYMLEQQAIGEAFAEFLNENAEEQGEFEIVFTPEGEDEDKNA